MSTKHKGRTAIPTEDPDSDHERVELQQVNNEKEEEEKGLVPSSRSRDSVKIPTSDDISEFVSKNMEKYTTWIMLPVFAICGIASVIIVIVCFFGGMSDLIGLLIILVITIMTAYMAMYGVYKWGEANDYIEFYKKQNVEYEQSTGELKKTQSNLKYEVEGIEEKVDNLEQQSVELNETIDSFDELHDALKDIVGDDEEVLNLIDELNQQYTDIKLLSMQKDKAQLLLGYYRVQFGGQYRDRFDKQKYDRFLARLNSETRQLYDDLGGFEAMDVDQDGNIDPEEFVKATEKVLISHNDTFVALMEPKISEK